MRVYHNIGISFDLLKICYNKSSFFGRILNFCLILLGGFPAMRSENLGNSSLFILTYNIILIVSGKKNSPVTLLLSKTI